MRLPRIYFHAALKISSEIQLDRVASNHILRVLRLRVGDQILLFNGHDAGDFSARIKAIVKDLAILIVETFTLRNSESPLKIHLGQGISRGEKMDFTIQKAVELGVNYITPIFTDFCNVKLSEERLQNRLRHWQAIAVSACEQSGRCVVPQILPAIKITDWVAAQTGLRLVLAPSGNSLFKNIEQHFNEVALLVGSEGGLSAAELSFATAHNFLSLRLGPRILRTETAALTAISILQARWGDL